MFDLSCRIYLQRLKVSHIYLRPRTRFILSDIKLKECWKVRLADDLQSHRMLKLKEFLRKEIQSGKNILPLPQNWFAALNTTGFNDVRVVIMGQDPYHGTGQAHGLSFSVQEGVALPPSLQNIYKELQDDLGIKISSNGNLSTWAKQGVLLLNSVLTVEEGKAASHQKRGWEEFTDLVIRLLNEERTGLVFLLWGASAQKKAAFVDRKKHLVLESAHPSPLSSYRGFFGSKPFSKINSFLESQGHKAIDWRV
jgi:uracil-DNA glycosylase